MARCCVYLDFGVIFIAVFRVLCGIHVEEHEVAASLALGVALRETASIGETIGDAFLLNALKYRICLVAGRHLAGLRLLVARLLGWLDGRHDCHACVFCEALQPQLES